MYGTGHETDPPQVRQPQVRQIDIGDAVIEYLYYPGSGPTLVLLHATGFMPWLWHPIARALAGDYAVIAPYFCDHRDAAPENGGLGWVILAEDLVRFCEGLALQTPVIMGHSMGATVATLANALTPTFAARMILIEPIYLPDQLYQINLPVADHPLAGRALKRRNFWENEAAATDYLKSKPLFQAWDDEIFALYIRYGLATGQGGGLSLACAPRHEAALFMGSLAADPWPLLPRVTCPVLVVEGGRSENRAFIDLKKATAAFPDGHYQRIEDAGHLVPMEKPQEIIGLARRFLGTP